MAKKSNTEDPETTTDEVTLEEEITETKTDGTTVNVQPHEDWEKRFKGMQSAYNKLQTQHAEQSSEYEKMLGEVEELRATMKNLEGEKKGILEQVNELSTMKETLESQINAHSIQEQRSKLIMENYMDLAAFEAQGLLPPASTVEEMKERFDNFRKAFNTTVDQTMKTRMVGMSAAPSSNTPPVARTAETVYAELTRLAGATLPAERAQYDALMKEWLELNK